MTIQFTGIRRIDHVEERRADALYWASRTIAERVIAGWELAEQELIQRNTPVPTEASQKQSTFTLRRVRRVGARYVVVRDRPTA